MQPFDSTPGYVRQIARIDECFSTKSWKHQAHQIDTRLFDCGPGGQPGGSVEVINSPAFRISLEQRFGCISHGWFHFGEVCDGSEDKETGKNAWWNVTSGRVA